MKSFSTSIALFLVLSLALSKAVEGFAPITTPCKNGVAHCTKTSSTTSISMGLFDGIMKAFENEAFEAPPEGIKATARHILVKSEEDATKVLDQIGQESSTSFADLAREYSTCPSSSQGGSLGSFSPGTMVPEFDKVIFDPETQLGEVVGPVQTDFGYHLIVVDKRTGV